MCRYEDVGTDAYEDQKWALELLELEMQMVVSHPTWMLGTGLRDSGRATNTLNY